MTRTLKINDSLVIEAEFKETRNAFKHIATLYKDGQEVESVKVVYVNRTWERFEYDTVIEKLINASNVLTGQEKISAQKIVDGIQETKFKSEMKGIKALALLGELMSGGSKSVANNSKVAVLKARFGNGIELPDDWNELSEAEKEHRLNGAIGALTEEN